MIILTKIILQARIICWLTNPEEDPYPLSFLVIPKGYLTDEMQSFGSIRGQNTKVGKWKSVKF